MRELRLAALLVDMEVIAEWLDRTADETSRMSLQQAMRKRLQEADALICADHAEMARHFKNAENDPT